MRYDEPPSQTLVQGPATEPVTLAEVKDHLRVTGTEEDTLLDGLIRTARGHVEDQKGIALITQTWDIGYHEFSPELELPRSPLQSVTSIQYLDDAGDEQTLATSVYRVEAAREPGRITLDHGQSWPTLYPVPDVVTVRIIAGHGDAAAVPPPIRQALLLLIGHWYENRESTLSVGNIKTIPMGVDSLLAPYRVHYF